MTAKIEPLALWEVFGPGLHRGITDQQYHVECNSLASQSVLKPLANGKSPAHVRERLLNPEPPSAAMQLGTAFHALVLQHGWHERVFSAPVNDRRTKAFKEYVESINFPDDAIIITPDELEQLKGMAMSVQRCHSAFWPIRRAIDTPDQSYIEAMGLWLPTAVTEMPITSWCKFRPDVFIPEHGIVLDLKTTQDADRKSFEKSIYNFGYHLQAGFYFEGLRRMGFTPEYYLIVAIEKDPPYGVRVYNLEPDVIDYGWEMMREPLRVFSECTASGVWPGWDDKAEDIGLPPWAMKESRAYMDLI